MERPREPAREAPPRDVQPERPAPEVRTQPAAAEAGSGLPAFITAPLARPTPAPEEPRGEPAQPTAGAPEAAGEDAPARPRRRRRTRAEIDAAEAAKAAGDLPVAD
jgi:hypothetical protein